jgi:uncharacterized protein (TIGR03435 family)
MIPSLLLHILNHLWQSTLFAAVAGSLTLLLRKNGAHARYCLWLAASYKFLVPFSLLVFAGGQLKWHTVIPQVPSAVPLIIEQINEPFGAQGSPRPAAASHTPQFGNWLVPMLIAMWAAGFAVVVFSWWLRRRKVRDVLRAASPVPLGIGVPAFSSASCMEPGVFGVLRPVLLLPEGIADRLAPAELQAVLAHELCHVRRRDNLATAMHMIVEAVFWFHPLVWWIGARLMEERERACDEEVLHSGAPPEAYAEGILKVCELYLQSPLRCVAGVTGANLKQRIEAIMDNRSTPSLTFPKKAGLAVAGVLAVAIPLTLGLTHAPLLRAQAHPDQRFEVASTKRVEIPDNGTGTPALPDIVGIGASDAHRLTAGIVPRVDGTAFQSASTQGKSSPGRTAQFEVASIHEIVDGVREMGGLKFSGPRAEYRGFAIPALIAEAWNVRGDAVALAPGISPGTVYPTMEVGRSARIYNIEALAPEGTAPERNEFRLMLQSLLTTRFKLATHTEKREKPVYVLSVYGTPKLKESSEDETCRTTGSRTPEGQKLVAKHCPIDVLIRDLLVDRPIYDETGLTGFYDFEITAALPFQADDPDAISPFSAVKDFGLKLEAKQLPVDTIVIDHVEAPGEN